MKIKKEKRKFIKWLYTIIALINADKKDKGSRINRKEMINQDGIILKVNTMKILGKY